MASPTLREREPSPEYTTPSERVIDVASESPALLRGASGSVAGEEDGNPADEEDVDEDASDALDDVDDDSAGSAGLTELDLSEHEYRRGRQAVPMQSPGDELEIEGGRRRRGLSSLPRRQFFDGDDASFARPSGRGRMMQRITFRRRKSGGMDTFWTSVFISNLLSLALMSVLMFYLLQTDFFESHQSDLFGTTVDNRFTVVSPESTDAKIYMKSGYSTSRYSEAMIAFGNGELKIGRRALATTDVQGFYGLSIANNGSTTFTNKLIAPFVKTDYLHAVRAVVFDDGTAMTTAANLSGGINEVGDVNVNSKTGSITMSAGGKPVLKVDPDATVNLLNAGEDDMEKSGITFNAAHGDISIASDFVIHHDDNSTVVSSTHSIELNSTKLVVGAANSSKTLITVPSMTNYERPTDAAVYEKISLAISGQSSINQSHGGDVIISGGDGRSRGGDIMLVGGESAESEDGDVSYGSIMINAKLERTTFSKTEIGSHSRSHQVNLHGSVSINNATESGHGTRLFVGGGSMLITSKNLTVSNAATNRSIVGIHSNRINLEASSAASLSMNENVTRLVGSKSLVASVVPKINSSHSVMLSMGNAGQMELNATRSISLNAIGANSSININGAVRFGGDLSDGNDSDSIADMTIEDGSIAVDADSLVVGSAGNTDEVALMAKDITIGNSTQKSSLHIAGVNASILVNHVSIGTSVSSVVVTGKDINLRGKSTKNETTPASLSISGSSLSMTGDEVTIGDKSAKSITIGGSSSSQLSIASSVLVLGASAKSVSIGEKTAAVKIGSETTTIDIKGKVIVNGEELNARRRLESASENVFAIARTDDVVIPLPSSDEEVDVPLHLISNSMKTLTETGQGYLELLDNTATSAVALHLGLSLHGVRWRVEKVDAGVNESRRPPKLRCRVYKVQEPSTGLLEVVTPLETCEGDDDCHSGFFIGASNQRVVQIQSRDQLSLRCAATSTTSLQSGFRLVLIDSIQLDISSR